MLRQLGRTLDESDGPQQAETAADTVHDLQGPLTAITGLVLTLRDRWDLLSPSDRDDLLDRIARQAARGSQLVAEVLELTRLEAGRLPIRLEPVMLRPVIAGCVADLGGTVKISCRRDLRVTADPSCLERVVMNLLRNAAEHGTPPVRIRSRLSGEWVETIVSDSGAGVPAELRDLVFERYAKAEATLSGGAGLGLSIVRRLVQEQGGSAWYAPRDAGGSLFGFRLRVAG